MSRAAVMVLALLVVNTLMGVLSLVVARSERTTRALRLWGWGALIYSLGLAITLITSLPVDLVKVVGNGLIAYAPIPMIEGVLIHTRWRLRMRWIWALYAMTVAVVVYNHLRPHPMALLDFIGPAPLANILFAIGVLALLLAPTPDAKLAAKVLAATFGFALAVFTARMLLLWLSLGTSPDRDRADLTVSLFVIGQLVVAVTATMALMWIEVRNMEAELERIAFTDPLTKLLNRRATLMRFEEEIVRTVRRQETLGMLVMDVDHFKRFNDTYGHQAGDAVLAHVAETLTGTKRGGDVLGRIGGEEFLLLFTGLSPEGAREAANRVRECVAASPLAHSGRELTVTLSGGLSLYPADGDTWDALFSAADQRLYAAKREGRNRIVGPGVQQCQTTS